MKKRCPRCENTKALDLFRADKKGKLGRDGWCKSCRKDARETYFYANPDAADEYKTYVRSHNRQYNLKRSYGLTLGEYEMLYAGQNGLCAMCSESFVQLCVDHDHATGKVRGLLCGSCNIALGHYEKVKDCARIYLAKVADTKRVSI